MQNIVIIIINHNVDLKYRRLVYCNDIVLREIIIIVIGGCGRLTKWILVFFFFYKRVVLAISSIVVGFRVLKYNTVEQK